MVRATAETAQRPPRSAGLSLVTLASFALGVPVGVGLLLYIYRGPWRETILFRYVSHPVEWAEVVLFCCALAGLLAKVWDNVRERWAFRGSWLPPASGQLLAAGAALPLLDDMRRQGQRPHKTILGRRLAAILDFVGRRGCADNLDEHLRTLADNDALAQENSYALHRFITWAIPILGFLGTVLGITDAVANVSPETLESTLSEVTNGLATAFDTTAVALVLTMVLMFGGFVSDRLEQGVLEEVDRYVDEHLAHRFERTGVTDGSEFAALLRQSTQSLLGTMGQLVQQQADIWSRSLKEAEKRWHEAMARQQQILTRALEDALQRTLASHTQQVAQLDKQAAQRGQALVGEIANLAKEQCESGRQCQAALVETAKQLATCTGSLEALQEADGQLVRLQDTLQKNLTALAGAGAFEQAVHSLTAAIHLLTGRLVGSPAAAPARSGPGKAAA